MLIINDDRTCACGAYLQNNGYCANGHPVESTDYVIEEIHKTQYGNTQKKVKMIFDSKEAGEKEIKKDQYKWRGNQTGSVTHILRLREPEDRL
jgi:hypothetical protein